MPDNVFICSKQQAETPDKDFESYPLERVSQYANLQMKLFYGCDLVQVHKEVLEKFEEGKHLDIRDPVSDEKAFSLR